VVPGAGRQLSGAFGATIGPKIVDRNILTFDQTVLGETRLKLFQLVRIRCRSALWSEKTNMGSFICYQLRARHNRPCCRTSEPCDELPPSHPDPRSEATVYHEGR
jgi:hypothetical protein